ncbi:Uncharacterized protein Rs2_20240 [Raphanus sativus]|nr:Uncharacterized protein Rs2_20240 [Raphanus sativus]
MVCFWSNDAVAGFDGAVEMRLARFFFREMEAPSTPSAPVPVSATGMLFQIRRRRLLSPACKDEISPRCLSFSPIIATRDFKACAVKMFGAGELRFDSGEPKCGFPMIASRGGGAAAGETRVPRCGGVNTCPVLSLRSDLHAATLWIPDR